MISKTVKISQPEGTNSFRMPSSPHARPLIITSRLELDMSPMNKTILKQASEGKRSWISNGQQSVALKNTCGRMRQPITRFFA